MILKMKPRDPLNIAAWSPVGLHRRAHESTLERIKKNFKEQSDDEKLYEALFAQEIIYLQARKIKSRKI